MPKASRCKYNVSFSQLHYKWFSPKSIFFSFLISPFECDVVLFVVLHEVVWFIISYSINEYMMHEYFSYIYFIILFICILLLYTINLDVVNLFADSSFLFLIMLNDVLHQFKWMNIYVFVKKKHVMFNMIMSYDQIFVSNFLSIIIVYRTKFD